MNIKILSLSSNMTPISQLQSLIIVAFAIQLASASFPAPPEASFLFASGSWETLQETIGISAMHMQLLHNNKIIMFDRTDFGPSNLSLPNHLCRFNDERLPRDCTAHSIIYDLDSNTFRPLMLQTDTWCSSGALDASGLLIQTGGYHSGERSVRIFSPCEDATCDWEEIPIYLSDRRWYSSNQILPDGTIIVVGGRGVFTYEFFPKTDSGSGKFYLKFLRDTFDYPEENNLYPFLHLLPDGNLFIFANNRSISFDYTLNRVVREFPRIPEDRRSYPYSGSSVLLPIRLQAATELPEAEVMICGGAPAGAYYRALKKKVHVAASRSCGRIRVTDPDSKWVMEEMPMPRVMSDMVLLPNGHVLLINGASNGTAGWELGRNPVLNPLLYNPNEEVSDSDTRFRILTGSGTARMYHSSAVLVPDGRVLVGGSNPHSRYDFRAYPYPTELSLEAFSPPYLAEVYAPVRPSVLTVEAPGAVVTYGGIFAVNFLLPMYPEEEERLEVTLVAPSFTTHSLGMNQRVLILEVVGVFRVASYAYRVTVVGPPTNSVAPPGYYMLFVVHFGVPSHGVWVKVQ